jgi:branched-chain amino acid transport system substrate-binding protein
MYGRIWQEKKMVQRSSLLLAFALASSCLLSCQKQRESYFTIGAVLPLTGDSSQWGIPPRNGAELAIDEINSQGGVGGMTLRLQVEDDKCIPREGISALDRLNLKNTKAVVGAVCSSVTLAIAPLVEQKKIVLISPASTNPEVTDAGEYVFRVAPSDTFRGTVFADYLYDEAGLTDVDFLYVDNAGGVGSRDAFKARFNARGGKVVREEPYPDDAMDLSLQIGNIIASESAAVVVVSYPRDTVLILRQARELGLKKPLFFQTEAMEDASVLQGAGEAAEGSIYILSAAGEGEVARTFQQAYNARFGRDPELYAAEGYDAIKLIAEALRNQPPDAIVSSDRIRDFLIGTKDWVGASGTLTFDKNGDVQKPMVIKQIRNGKPVIMLTRTQQLAGNTPPGRR